MDSSSLVSHSGTPGAGPLRSIPLMSAMYKTPNTAGPKLTLGGSTLVDRNITHLSGVMLACPYRQTDRFGWIPKEDVMALRFLQHYRGRAAGLHEDYADLFPANHPETFGKLANLIKYYHHVII